MALKFGRTSRNTSSILPDGRIRYSQAEYDANVSAIASEASRKKDYDASMAKFKTDSDTYYGKSAVDTKGAAKIASAYNAAGNKGSKGQSYTATGAGSKTQEQMDKEFDAMVKSGQIVPFNDPSITAKTRELYTGANYGEDLSKKYIRKNNYDTYNQIFGEDYNPLQKKKDALAGKLSQSELQTVHEPIVDIGTFSRFGAPVSPGAYVPKDVKPIDLKNSVVDWDDDGVRLKPLKPTKIDEKPLGKQRQEKPIVEKEKERYTPPEKGYKLPKKVSMNPFAKGATSQGSTKRYIGEVGEAIGSRVKNVLKGNLNKHYSKERDVFYDTYGGGETIGKEGFGDMSLDEVKSLKKTIRKDPGLSSSDFKEGKRDLNSAIKMKKWEAKGKVRFWSEAEGKEYRNSADYVSDRKLSTDNATNSNTVTSQQEKLALASETPSAWSNLYNTNAKMKEKYATANPGSTPRQIRQGVRAENALNKQIIKNVDASILKKHTRDKI